MTVYRDDVMSQTRIYEWHKCFREGQESVNDDSKSGRLSTARNDENVAQVRKLICADRRLTIRMIAEELGMGKDQHHRHPRFGHSESVC